MPKIIDLIGKRFGRLVVFGLIGKDKYRNYRWLCRCKCKDNNQNEVIVIGDHLKSGHTKSCGCLHTEAITRHGHCKNKRTKIYSIWISIVQRCINSNSSTYHNYGGRGIIVCKRWRKFENFLEDMKERPTKDHSIHREDNDGNYCKENCRWATRKQQMRNTRRNHLITHNGKTQCLIEWSEEIKISKDIIRMRLKRGWSIKRVFTTPIRKRRKNG